MRHCAGSYPVWHKAKLNHLLLVKNCLVFFSKAESSDNVVFERENDKIKKESMSFCKYENSHS